MGFTTPAFILKNTLELRKKLEELGYKVGNERYINDAFLATDNNEIFGIDEPYRLEQCNGYIHCGTNESLFLAIAALRDDTDKNQWFVLDHDNIWEAVGCYQYKGDFILCNHDRWYCGTDVAQAHKATVKELQELFSPKIQVPQIEWNINDVINKD